ncbi:hypothetical protein CR513_08856, partial [Mucuna pruriens]
MKGCVESNTRRRRSNFIQERPHGLSTCGGFVPSGARASQVPSGGNGLLHQMDRGGASSLNLGREAVIVIDNDTQFAAQAVIEFCTQYGIKQSFTSVEHPQSNGQAEVVNRVILRQLGKRLEEVKGRWVKDLCQSHNNEEELRANLDLLQEEREMTHIRECAAKARVARRYNATVFPRPIPKDDLVLRKTLMGAATNKPIQSSRRSRALEHLNGKAVPRTWNLATLRKYYVPREKSKTHKRRPVSRTKPKTHKMRLVPRTKSKTHKRHLVPREKSKTHKRQPVPKGKSKTHKRWPVPKEKSKTHKR